jgi:hypothetical protein
MDGDLQFENEFRRADPLFRRYAFTPRGQVRRSLLTSTGHVTNRWSVGPALFWAPFFMLGHGLILVGRAHEPEWKADGYSTPYRWFTALGTAVYAFLGLLLAHSVARKVSRPGPAFLGTLGVWGASSLPVYQYFLPFWPGALVIFPAALLLVLWHRDQGWGIARWTALGVLSGLLAISHPVAVAWLTLPLLSLVGLDPGNLGQRIRALGALLAGMAVAAVPELIGKAIVEGSPFRSGYQTVWQFSRPHFLRTLFGAEHGLISWTPIVGLALVGLWWVLRHRDRRLGIGTLAVFAVMLYVVASYATPEGSSFGNRFFVLYTPGFVVGAAGLAEAVWQRWRLWAVVLATALVIWNALFAFQWAWGLLPKRGPVNWGDVVRNQFTVAPKDLAHAVPLFFTDRAALIRIVERNDFERIKAGGDFVPGF